ncbi:tRNA-binding domain [Phaffia rhodozyma]|uniref:tRNA-binding domain n=1 Tax=Phaffia rhodozyma TaxID=264483 RepID=A0A0F7SIU8_PHARH|nr:tRNA-binding domain [Phaffia rhodozyma]
MSAAATSDPQPEVMTVVPPPAKELHPLKEAFLPLNTAPPNQDIRVGIITAAKPTPKALRPAYFLTIDFGPEIGVRNSSTQIVEQNPDIEGLIGTKVCCVINVERLRLGRVYSECLTLGVKSEEGGTVLVRPDPRAKIGSRVF